MVKFLERHKLAKLTQKENSPIFIKWIEFALKYILTKKNFRPRYLHSWVVPNIWGRNNTSFI